MKQHSKRLGREVNTNFIEIFHHITKEFLHLEDRDLYSNFWTTLNFEEVGSLCELEVDGKGWWSSYMMAFLPCNNNKTNIQHRIRVTWQQSIWWSLLKVQHHILHIWLHQDIFVLRCKYISRKNCPCISLYTLQRHNHLLLDNNRIVRVQNNMQWDKSQSKLREEAW